MPKLFSDYSWTYPLEIRQRMAEDITTFGHITTTTIILKQDYERSMNDQQFKDYQAGYPF